MGKQDKRSLGLVAFGYAVLIVWLVYSLLLDAKADTPCKCKPAPTPAACCKADGCRQELAQVDARFGDVWDELVEVQEQLAKVKACCCEPSKPCACSGKPACECKPSLQPVPAIKETAPKLKYRIFKRCK